MRSLKGIWPCFVLSLFWICCSDLAAETCRADQMQGSLSASDLRQALVTLKNSSSKVCTLQGYPEVDTGQGFPAKRTLRTSHIFMAQPFILPPGGEAYAQIQLSADYSDGQRRACELHFQLAGADKRTLTTWTLNPCGRLNEIAVSAFSFEKVNAVLKPVDAGKALPCATADLRARDVSNNVTAGSAVQTIGLMNVGRQTCSLKGTPSLQLQNESGKDRKIETKRTGKQSKLEVRIAPGHEASFSVRYPKTDRAASCKPSDRTVVQLSTGGLSVPAKLAICKGAIISTIRDGVPLADQQ